MYFHTQVGWITLIVLVEALVAIGVTAQEVRLDPPEKPFFTTTMALFKLMIPLMGSLTVTADDEVVTARFDMGLSKKGQKYKI